MSHPQKFLNLCQYLFVCGNICQLYTRNWTLLRNFLIFVPRHMTNTCQVFGSQYSQVKLEGPLHIPGIYQSVVGLGFAGIRPVYVVKIWHTPGIRGLHLKNIQYIYLLKSFLICPLISYCLHRNQYRVAEQRLGQKPPFLPIFLDPLFYVKS